MKKRILCLVMGLVLTAGMSMTAFAEDYKDTNSWTADYNGKEIVTNFGKNAVADTILQILPGDSIEVSVTIKNSDSRETDWYMTNEIIQTLEQTQTSAEEGAYEYRLTYTNSDGVATDLYVSDSVGGTNAAGDAGAPEGLLQLDGAAGEYFYLERLKQGETGKVTLWMRVDGETQGNGYQETLAKLGLNFAVEVVPEAVVRTEVNHRVNRVSGGTQIVTTVQTGDTTPLMIWSAVALGCGVILLVVGMAAWKRNREKGE